MNDTTRCEPAEHLRGVDGWHLWRHEQGDIEYWWWFAEERTWRGGISGDEFVAGDPVMTRHRRYVAPVTTPAEVEALRAEVARMKAAASTINEEVCQTLGKVLGYPWFKDDPVNFPDSTEAHGVCVGDHVAGSIAAEAAERIEALRLECNEWCQSVQLLEDVTQRRKNERDALGIAFTKLSAVLRVNMLRHGPEASHAEIDAAIAACLGPAARAALAKEAGDAT